MEFIKKDYLERIGRLRMLDDDFMSKVFEDPKCAEILLRIILKISSYTLFVPTDDSDMEIMYSTINSKF